MFSTRRLMPSLLVLSLATLACPAAAGAAEDPDAFTVVVHVPTQGLNLASPDGQATLRSHVKLASHRVCLKLNDGAIYSGTAMLTCEEKVFSDAWGQASTMIAKAESTSQIAAIAPK